MKLSHLSKAYHLARRLKGTEEALDELKSRDIPTGIDISMDLRLGTRLILANVDLKLSPGFLISLLEEDARATHEEIRELGIEMDVDL